MTSPSGVAVAALKGHTKPRLYTPPLAVNCNIWIAPELSCPCGCGLHAGTSWGFDCIDFLTNVLKWQLIPYQRWLYIHALEKGPGGEGFRFKTLVILIARQNGKTQWLRGLGLWRLYLDSRGRSSPDCPAAKTVVIAAQGLEYAEGTLGEVVNDVKECRALKREFLRHRQTNGKHAMLLSGRRSWRAVAANRKGGRSMSVDLAELDELREHHDWLAWNAITPTTQARQYSQNVAASNAGDKRSVVLRSLRDGAMAKILARDTEDTKTGLFEYSAPQDANPLERKYWPMANPALGYLPGHDEDALAAKAEAMADNMAGFVTEHLCQWVDTLLPGVMPMEDWNATTDPESRRAEGAPVYAAVDVSHSRSKAYIAVASRRSDGLLHVEVVAAHRGTDWVVPWFKARPGKFVAVAVQARGCPASDLIEPLTEAGVPVMELGGAELVRGAGGVLFDGIRKHAIWHRPSPALDTAAKGTVSRSLGGDTWVLDRKNSPVDAAPLVACAAAAWAEGQGPMVPDKVPEVHEWPDEEEIAEWEKELDELQ
ncbi:terminase [Mycobacterium phage Cracklewink]|uniref:Terminase n=1 Tax=Mycobacterium phage Bipper TaxID=1805457 RepID=A0A142F2D8_9CAUD|nr:terminase [Mycobacterium phage Bipper]AMQ66945.1 terminase [Mycobacterium phage Bipper]QDF19296.1 terminase [Mycobacterium phage Cracklewink]